MAVYSSMVITNLGLSLYSKVQAGAPLNFTRMQIGGGQLAVGQDPVTLTALISLIANFSINSIKSTGNTAQVKGIFQNTSINSSTYSCELGLFATDPDLGEILYAYANAGTQGDTIPPISAGPYSKQYQINAAIGNASNVTATIPDTTYIPTSDKGIAGGVATLDSGSKVPIANIPQINHTSLSSIGTNTHAQIDAHIDATTGVHGSTSTASANTIMQRDGDGQANVGTPTASTHIARKQDVDAALTAASNAQATANAALPKSGGKITGDLEVVSGANHVFLLKQGYFASNAYYDGGWMRANTDYPAFLIGNDGTSQTPLIYHAPAGANPITWSGPYQIITSAGGTVNGNINITAPNFIGLGDGGKLADQAGARTYLQANQETFEVLTEDGATTFFKVSNNDPVAYFKGRALWDSGAGTSSLAANGYQKLPSGLIIQWGKVSVPANSTASVTFPTAFPSAAMNVQLTGVYNGTLQYPPYVNGAPTTSGFTAGNGTNATQDVYWFALGY